MELLDPNFWTWPDLSLTAGADVAAGSGVPPALLAVGAITGLAVLIWAAA
jgi:hypothetical protein